MYAIAFDLEIAALQQHYHNPSYNNAYNDIKNHLAEFGFTRQQGSVYFGDSTVDAVACVLAVMNMSATFAWFSHSVRDIRMLRIEEQNDLMPAVNIGATSNSNSPVVAMSGP